MLSDGPTTIVQRRDKLDIVGQSLQTLSQRYAETRSALTGVLTELGLTQRPLIVRGLGKVQEILALIGTISPIRQCWFDVERRKEILEFLDKAQSALPEFSEAAAIRLGSEPDKLACLKRLNDKARPSLQADGIATVVTFREKLNSVLQSLRTLSQRHAEMQSHLLKVLTVLGLAPRRVAPREIGMVQELLGLVGKVSPIRRSWLDTERRREVSSILERHREDEEKNTQCRLRLLDRMLPTAFDGTYAHIVLKCRSYRPVWWRVFPSWWILRRRLVPLYTSEIPGVEVLMDDLRDLAEYYRRLEFSRQIKREYAEHLILRQDGELDRERTIASMVVSERFDPIIRIFPELKDILVDPSRVDLDALRTSLEGLDTSYRSFHEALIDSNKYVDSATVFNSDGSQASTSLVEFGTWIEEQLLGLVECLGDVQVLCQLLKPGRDVSLDELPARISSIAELRQANLRQLADAFVLGEDGEVDRERTIAGVRASERLDPLIRAYPELKEILADQSRYDQDAYRKSLERLTTSYLSFRETLAHASKTFDLGMIFNADGSLSKMSLEEFAKWIEEQASSVNKRLAELNQFCRLLKPGSDVCLGDLHARLASIGTLRQSNLRQPADHFVIKEDGELDRDLTLTGLRASEQVQPLIRAYPELTDILVDPSRIDRDSFRTNLERLTSSYRSFSDAVAAASRHFDLETVGTSEGGLATMTVDELANWINGQTSGVHERLADLIRLCQALKPERDVSLGDLRARLAAIAELRQADLRVPADYFELHAGGELDRERTVAGLQASEQFDTLLRGFPELKEILVDQSRVDQVALNMRLEELTHGYRSFREALTIVEKHIDLAGVLGPDATQSKISLTDLAQFLERRLTALEALLEHLGEVSALLKPSHDLSLGDLSARLRTLADLFQSVVKIRRIAKKLDLNSAEKTIRDRDWGDVRATAEWTIGFLDRYADRPPEPLIRAATNPDMRQEAIDAVHRNMAAKTDEFTESWEFLTQLFDPNQEVSTGVQIGKASVPVLHDWVEQRRADAHLIQEWLRFCELREQIVQADLGQILSSLLDGKLAIEDAKAAYLFRCYRSWLDWVYERTPALERFTTDEHERLIDKFRGLDRDAIQRSFTSIREVLLGDAARPNATDFDAPNSSELGILLREVNKRKRHLPLRQLFARIPTVLLRLKPCLMMSPLAVSTYLNTKDIRFDLVIFDEASQVRPYDAISTIYRGRQLVVAGDQKQLPPTTFFDRTVSDEEISSEEDEIEETLKDFESILDVCCTLRLPRRRLRWHYRSRREPLIAFSNRHFYDNDLVTFPSVLDTGQMPAVRFEYLPEGRWKSGSSGGYNILEARKTAELVMAHFRTRPELSLGVIAFSQRQQMAIFDELERLRSMDNSLEDYFNDDQQEPFFVKNLENVQGDERDVIFLSIGYGPDESGRVSMRFGPLNQQRGERRLNVAITRSRSEMTVISSMKSHDIDLSRTTAVGAKLLRAYLDFAERGVSTLGSEITKVNEDDFDSPFEQEVAAALKQRGLEVRNQVGCSKYKIDLALVHPNNPGRFVLGIECDGATYHNSATARDRDRLRQEVLESCGWRIVRIWSTDWVRDPTSQINRVVGAFERSLIEVTKNDDLAKSARPIKPSKDEPPVSTKRESPANSKRPAVYYQRIEDVPSSEVKDVILSALEKYGVTDESELAVSVARQLGFQRTGVKIKTRIEGCVADLLTEKKIVRTDENGLKLNSNPSLRLT